MFGPDKALRHYAQHLALAGLGYGLILYFYGLGFDWRDLGVFFLFTFLPDLDGAHYVFLRNHDKKEVRAIVTALKKLKFEKAAVLATTHHKAYNRLLIHNVFGLGFFVFGFIYAIGIGSVTLLMIFGAILVHFAFDIFDDFWQMGHMDNWLWVVKKK